jgi:hypothetical protein
VIGQICRRSVGGAGSMDDIGKFRPGAMLPAAGDRDKFIRPAAE